jgi:DNA end-binding protein Ku
MARAYWKGFLRLSLVTCPVELFPATSQAEKTHFHQINRKTGNRLRQQMVDEETGKVVDKDQKGRGYELSKGKYVEIEPEELDAVEIESTRTIEIDTFVPRKEIDKRYFDHPYYIIPSDKTAAEAFAVIRDAMKDKERVAIGRIVMAGREHIMAIEPLGKGMIGTTLRYEYEVRGEKTYFKDVPAVRVPKDMVRIAEHILESKAGHFRPRTFKDRYENALKKLVRRKAKGHKIEVNKEKDEERGNVINLMDALKNSVKHKRKKSRSKRKAA